EKLGRPVKWVESRRENYVATTHGRDHVTYLRVGAKRDGTISALDAKTYANLGGVLSTIAPGIPTTLYARMLSGAYRIPAIHCRVLGVYTNTGMVDAYRGAGRPEATHGAERAVDRAASALGLDPVDVPTGCKPFGQGHETTMAQIVADELGVALDDVTVEHGDTLGTPFGYGTYGSRSAAVGAVAVYNALQRIKAKARRIAAHMLEADADDVVYENGRAFVAGSPDSAKTIQEIAAAAAVGYDLPPGDEPFLDDTSYYDPPNCTFPFGTHVAVVE